MSTGVLSSVGLANNRSRASQAPPSDFLSSSLDFFVYSNAYFGSQNSQEFILAVLQCGSISPQDQETWSRPSFTI